MPPRLPGRKSPPDMRIPLTNEQESHIQGLLTRLKEAGLPTTRANFARQAIELGTRYYNELLRNLGAKREKA